MGYSLPAGIEFPTTQLVQALRRKNLRLQRLGLHNVNLTKEDVDTLLLTLCNTELRVLDLFGNQIDGFYFPQFLEMVASKDHTTFTQSLQEIILHQNPCCYTNLNKEEQECVKKMLETIPSLYRLAGVLDRSSDDFYPQLEHLADWNRSGARRILAEATKTDISSIVPFAFERVNRVCAAKHKASIAFCLLQESQILVR